MIGFAPYEDPEIAVSVIITQGDTSYNCGPIVRDIVCRYFDIKINPEDQEIKGEEENEEPIDPANRLGEINQNEENGEN